MDFLVVENGITTNIVVTEPDIAEEPGFLSWHDDARIEAAYAPSSEARPPSVEDIAPDILVEREVWLYMLELTAIAAT